MSPNLHVPEKANQKNATSWACLGDRLDIAANPVSR
jgi:hypothetical protein